MQEEDEMSKLWRWYARALAAANALPEPDRSFWVDVVEQRMAEEQQRLQWKGAR